MKIPLLSCVVLAASLLHSANAQVVVDENTEFKNAFYAPGIPFLRGPSATLQPQLAGFNLLEKDGYGTGYIYDFCANFDEGTAENWTYDTVTPGMGILGRQDEIGALFSNALPEFDEMLADYIGDTGDWALVPGHEAAYDQLQAYAAGMQIALWELIHEDAATLSIDDTSGIDGNFRIDMDGAVPGSQADAADFYAEQFLANIRSTTNPWTNQGGYTYYFADAPAGEQDRLWVAVPEPSTTLLGAFGFLLLLRRRRP